MLIFPFFLDERGALPRWKTLNAYGAEICTEIVCEKHVDQIFVIHSASAIGLEVRWINVSNQSITSSLKITGLIPSVQQVM